MDMFFVIKGIKKLQPGLHLFDRRFTIIILLRQQIDKQVPEKVALSDLINNIFPGYSFLVMAVSILRIL